MDLRARKALRARLLRSTDRRRKEEQGRYAVASHDTSMPGGTRTFEGRGTVGLRAAHSEAFVRHRAAAVLSLTLSVAVLCCHSPKPQMVVTPAQVAGTYAFDRSGQNRGRKWSVNSVLTLTEPGSYVLDYKIVNDGERNDEMQTGTYSIHGDKVVLRGEKRESTELAVKGDSLVAKMDWPGRWFVRWVGGAPVYVRQRSR
jgi:hypothetical protein